MKIELYYNPYFVKSEFIINGVKQKENSCFIQLSTNMRLQQWIDRLYPLLLEKYPNDCSNIQIQFHGRELDAIDVEKSARDFMDIHKDCAISLETICVSSDSSRVEQLKKLYERGKSGPFAEVFNSDEMQQAFERALDPTFEVHIIATVSSGKSTLVNALLSNDLVPESNLACTATIIRIENKDGAPCFSAERYDSDDHLLESKSPVTCEVLTNWNSEAKTSYVDVLGDIPMLSESQDANIVLIDTPGPNISQNKEHERITLNAIKREPMSMVLYILNSTSLSTYDDKWLLQQVSEAMGKAGRQAQDRFIFVANKADCFDPEEGEDVASALTNVRKYLKNNKIDNPFIVPTSAFLAKLTRLARVSPNLLTKKEKRELEKLKMLFLEEPKMNMFEYVRPFLSSACVSRIEAKLAKAKEDLKVEIFSGIPIIEELLNEFLQKYALPMKLKNAIDTFESVLYEANVSQSLHFELDKTTEELEKTVANIEKFNNDEQRISKAQAFRQKVQNVEYDLSPKSYRIVQSIQEKSESLISYFRQKLCNSNASKQAALRDTWEVTAKCSQFDAETYTTLSEALETEFFYAMQSLRDEYIKYVEDVTQQKFVDRNSLVSLQRAALELPSAEKMVSRCSYQKSSTRSRTVSASVWWKPWTWWSTETEYYNVTEEFVDLTTIANSVASELRTFAMNNIENFKRQSRSDLKKAKNELLKLMDVVDVNMQKIQKQLRSALRDKELKQTLIQESRKKLDWYEDFTKRLHEILDV